VFRVPNGVAHGAQINVLQPDVVVAQINDFTGYGIRFIGRACIGRACIGRRACIIFFLSDNGGSVCKLGGVVVAVARALGIGAQNRADSRQRGVQLGVFVHHVGVSGRGLLQTRLRNYQIVNGDCVVFVAAVAAIVHNTIGVGQPNVVHVSAHGAEMHWTVVCCLVAL
jgi:hypothetical protein